jgi:hypothetical protein
MREILPLTLTLSPEGRGNLSWLFASGFDHFSTTTSFTLTVPKAKPTLRVGLGAGEGGVVVGFDEVADLQVALEPRSSTLTFVHSPGLRLRSGSVPSGDGGVIGLFLPAGRRESRRRLAEDDAEDVTVVAIAGEDDALGAGIRFEGEADGGVGVGEVVEDDGAVVLELLVELVVLRAGGGVVGEFPLAT